MLPQGYLSPLFSPRNIIVLGASPQQDKSAHILCSHLKKAGFQGKIFLPEGKSILGLPALRKIKDMPAQEGPFDLAVLALPPEPTTMPPILRPLPRPESSGPKKRKNFFIWPGPLPPNLCPKDLEWPY
jgi:hypothetical protein